MYKAAASVNINPPRKHRGSVAVCEMCSYSASANPSPLWAWISSPHRRIPRAEINGGNAKRCTPRLWSATLGPALEWTWKCCCCWQPGPNHDTEMLLFHSGSSGLEHSDGPNTLPFYRAMHQAEEEEEEEGVKWSYVNIYLRIELQRRQKCSHWFESAETKRPTREAFFKVGRPPGKQTKPSSRK